MDAEGLETFLTIHREGGFSRAAARLNRTQPAISRRIRLLEEELAVALFERTADGPVLSQAGSTLLPYAERALAALRDAENAVRALKETVAGPLPLAVVGTLASTRLSAALRKFARDFPAVDLSLRTATSAEVGTLVRRGEAVIGLRYDADPSPDLSSEIIAEEALVVICARDHRLAKRSIARFAQLRDERWLAFPDVPGRQEMPAAHIFALFVTHGLGDVSWTAVDSLTAQKRLVEAGFGIALVAESAVAEERANGSLSIIKIKDLRARRPVAAVTRKGGFLSTAATGLLERLRKARL